MRAVQRAQPSAVESVDGYLAWAYHRTDRHCWDLVRGVGVDLGWGDIGDRTPQPDGPVARARAFRHGVRAFRAVDAHTEPSIVLLRPVSPGVPHVGVYLRGRVLHLSRAGARFERLAELRETYEIEGWYVP